MQKINMQIINRITGLMRPFFQDLGPENEINHKIKHYST